MASQLQSAAEEMQSQLQSLASLAQSIDWIGENRNQFEAEVQQLVQAIAEQARAGVVLSDRVVREVQEWESVAANAMGVADQFWVLPSKLLQLLMAGAVALEIKTKVDLT